MFTKAEWDKSFIFNSIRLRREWLKFQELIRNVEHHVEEEESEMFPLAEQELAEDLDEMSEEMQELKADLQGS
jgi:hemerythrin-like domain-containing protein